MQAVKEWTQFFKIDVDTFLLPLNVLDTTSDVLNMKRAKAEYIIGVHTIPTIALLLKDSKRFGLDAKVYATYSGTSEDVIQLARPMAKNFFGVHPYSSWYDDTPGMIQMREITKKYQPDTKPKIRNYTQGWVTSMICAEGLKRAGRNLTPDTLVDAYETFRNFSTGDISGPVSYSKTDHKGGRTNKLYKTDIEKQSFIPITGFREPAFKD